MHPKHSAFVLVSVAAVTLGAPGSARTQTAPQVVSPATVTMNPSGFTPLAGEFHVSTDLPTRLELEITDGNRRWQIRPQGLRTTHQVPIFGLRAQDVYFSHAVLTTAGGQKVSDHANFGTPPLPTYLTDLSTRTIRPSLREPGVTLVAARWSTLTETGSYPLLLDRDGEIIWFYDNPAIEAEDVELLRNGNLLMNHGGQVTEIDMLGNTVTEFWPTGPQHPSPPAGAVVVDTDWIHHECHELPEGEDADFLALSIELRVFPDYPIDPADPSITTPNGQVVGDVIVEFNRDGTIVRELHLLDIFDPYRQGYHSTLPFWNQVYGPITYDWSHGNSVILDPSDNTYVVSMRHQEAVAKIDRATGAIVWILGNHDNWIAPWDQHLLAPAGAPFEWPYHQHAPELNAAGNLVLFDNGNYRVMPPVSPPPTDQWYSRAVEFRVDETASSVSQVWEYSGATYGFFSGFLGDADPLPVTGNVLMTDGARDDGFNRFARVVEVTHTDPPLLVQESLMEQPGVRSWRFYRSEREQICAGIPGLNLRVEPAQPGFGEAVEIAITGGAAGKPALLTTVAIDGAAFTHGLLMTMLDFTGTSILHGVVTDPALSGHSAQVRVIAVTETSSLETSCDTLIEFQ